MHYRADTVGHAAGSISTMTRRHVLTESEMGRRYRTMVPFRELNEGDLFYIEAQGYDTAWEKTGEETCQLAFSQHMFRDEKVMPLTEEEIKETKDG